MENATLGMKVYLISDTHFNHANIATYCDRPKDFTERIIHNWRQIVKPEDSIIHIGDVFIGKVEGWTEIYPQLTGKKTLVRGNHDRNRSPTWWMEHGFDSCCDSMVFRRCWITHEPAEKLSPGCMLNIHGHLHNVWHGFHPNDPKGEDAEKELTRRGKLKNEWQRLFAVEYTNYMPVEFDKFVYHPEKYNATGLSTK